MRACVTGEQIPCVVVVVIVVVVDDECTADYVIWCHNKV